MKHKTIKYIVLLVLFFSSHAAQAQSYVVKDIRNFGAKGNGKTNDQAAFEKAATFFNARGGYGKLIISPGKYLVGYQEFTGGENGQPAYYGHDVLQFEGVKNLQVEGKNGATIIYVDSMRFGAFDPHSGRPFANSRYFVKYAYAAFIGNCILIKNSEKVLISDLELDGNNSALILGGVYGDKGRQLPHTGIFILNSRDVKVQRVKAHNFALDGIMVSNRSSNAGKILLSNSKFEYNGRQGFSWIGGNDLSVIDCSFSHTGKGGLMSPPGAGVDIEAEVGPIRNGRFINCEFSNNTGVGMVADNGNSSNISFTKCTFWGVSTWSVWVNRPAFAFDACNLYGSFVHGYNASTDDESTKFINCHFEDKPYQGKEPYGNFLVESNGRRRVSFTNCTFITHKKKLLWVQIDPKLTPNEKYQFVNCQFIINNENLPNNDFIAVIRGIRYKNCTFRYTNAAAKEKHYYLNSCCGNMNVDEGGNKIVYDN